MKTRTFTIIFFTLVLLSVKTRAGVPRYSSYPSAAAVIFLDFDGHTVTGTPYNFNQTNLFCATSGLNDDHVTKIYKMVAEDFRPFNLNITTDSTVFLAAPLNKRMRVIITTTWEWYAPVGGVALTGSFTTGNDIPCFVFSSKLQFNIKAIAEASSHEAGHTLGLSHQAAYTENCQLITPYYGGRGTGEIGWAPIMGVGYYQNTTQWYNGPNIAGCTSYQDDLSIITTGNGLSFRPDDHGNTNADATAVQFVSNQFSATGVVEKPTDADVISFTLVQNSRVLVTANPFSVGPANTGANIDLQLTLSSTANNLVKIFNPASQLNSFFDSTLQAGTYYIKVEGKGNIYASDYASLGSYTLTGTIITEQVLPMRVLKLNGTATGNNRQLQWMIDADEQVTAQVLEVSADGSHFKPVTNPASNDRSYIYAPDVKVNAQYRLKVSFSNGKQYFSNTVLIRSSGNVERPKLVSSLVQNYTLAITSPGNYNYIVYDLNGKIVRKGTLSSGFNTISTSGVQRGMYLVRFTGGSGEWTDKLILQ